MSTPEQPPVDATAGEATVAEVAPASEPAAEPAAEPAKVTSFDANAGAEAEAPMPSLIDNVTNDDETLDIETKDADAEEQQQPKEEDGKAVAIVEAAPEPSKGEEDKAIDAPVDGDQTEEVKPADGNKNEEDGAVEAEESTFQDKLAAFYWKNEFLILILLAILVAKLYPPIGAKWLVPKITATWVAVMFIFLLAGLGLKTEEFSQACQRCSFNSFVTGFNFLVDSSIVFGISKLLSKYNIINSILADGMVITSCLPLTINMCVVLTKAAGGDEASSIFNSAFGNLLGVFLSPALILFYIGVSGKVKVVQVFFKLSVRVLLPIIIGQLLKWFVAPVNDFVKKFKKYFKALQMYSLVYIVYTVFCKTFTKKSEIPVGDIFLMMLFVGIIVVLLMVLAWYSLRLFFRDHPKLRVMGLFGCTHKTVAMGIPLINAIYENDPNLAMYTLPLLIWHPFQLVIGTLLTPYLMAWTQSFPDLDDNEDEEGDEKKPEIAEGEKAIAVEEKEPDDVNKAIPVEEKEPNDVEKAIPVEEKEPNDVEKAIPDEEEGAVKEENVEEEIVFAKESDAEIVVAKESDVQISNNADSARSVAVESASPDGEAVEPASPDGEAVEPASSIEVEV